MSATVSVLARPIPLRELVALTKPRITALNLVAAAAGFALARAQASAAVFGATLLGTGLVIGAANALNCYLERDLDKAMARTRNRPLAAGRIAPQAALVFGLALAAIGVPLLSFAVNPLAGLLGAAALVGYVLIYTPLKQVTSAALLVGAVPGAAPPLIGWAAATGGIDLPGVLLFVLLFFWQVPHFLAITLFRLDDYAKAGFKVFALERGERATRRELFVYAASTVATSLMFVLFGSSGLLYLTAALILGGWVLVLALRGLRANAGPLWARSFFMATNLYLTLLMGALVLDRYVG
ncbi:MAG: protoheme IX farnesyltransferase [Deltaproteobacteria bacterium]|nr:protoheme IX farnesyltransferase [Deltaproteobacteria bacterium]